MIRAVGPVAYLDANVFIDALEGPEALAVPIKELFAAGRVRPGALATSELTLAEVLGPSQGQARPAPLRRLYLNLIVWGRFVDLRPVSRDVLYETVELRTQRSLKLPDAIHLATAVLARCSFFVSRDRDFKRLSDWMQGVKSDSASLAQVTGAIRA